MDEGRNSFRLYLETWGQYLRNSKFPPAKSEKETNPESGGYLEKLLTFCIVNLFSLG